MRALYVQETLGISSYHDDFNSVSSQKYLSMLDPITMFPFKYITASETTG